MRSSNPNKIEMRMNKWILRNNQLSHPPKTRLNKITLNRRKPGKLWLREGKGCNWLRSSTSMKFLERLKRRLFLVNIGENLRGWAAIIHRNITIWVIQIRECLTQPTILNTELHQELVPEPWITILKSPNFKMLKKRFSRSSCQNYVWILIKVSACFQLSTITNQA